MEAPHALRLVLAGVVIFGLSVLAGIFLARTTADPVDTQAAVVSTEADTSTTTTASSPTTTASTIPSDAPRPIAQTSTTTIAPIRDFADLFEGARGAIANVDVVQCDANAQGTAFLVDAQTAYTAWHVVEDAAQIALDFGEQRVQATVIGRNPERDVAVLRLAARIENAVTIPVAQSQPRVGEEVAAIGHPQGLPLAMTVGRVTSMNGEFDFEGAGENIVDNLIQTDSVIALGSSGGPLLNQRGEVVGVLISRELETQGLAYAADIDGVREELLGWTLNPEPVRPSFCVGSIDLNDIDGVAPELITSEVDTPQVPGLQRTFAVFSQTINSGRADQAFGLLTPSNQASTTEEMWVEGQETRTFWDWNIRSIQPTENGLNVRSTFRSTQEAEFGFDGQSECTRWDLTYNMVLGQFQGREFWLIDRSQSTAGAPPVDCADWEPSPVQRQRLSAPALGESVVMEDFLAAGTIDGWTVDVRSGDGGFPRAFTVELVATTEAFEPVLEISGVVAANPPDDDEADDEADIGADEQDEQGEQATDVEQAVDIQQVEQPEDVADAEQPEAGTTRQTIVIDTPSQLTIEVGDLGDERGGNYRLVITNVTG